MPLHPGTEKVLGTLKGGKRDRPNVLTISPVGYLNMISLEANARVIITDSGGIQKEAFFAEVPCVTLRDETEWVETIDAGSNYLAGTDTQIIVNAFQKATESKPNYSLQFYGNGRASNIVVQHLVSIMAD